MFEKQALRRWDPVPVPGTYGTTGTFSSITGVAFSPIRPLIFAAGSAEGFLYLYDLSSPSSAPKVTLEIPVDLEKKEKRSGITGIAFNRRQRDLIAACDYSGKIHIWRLSWDLSHGQPLEQESIKKMGNASLADEEHSGR
jgi:WD40 repeat protein